MGELLDRNFQREILERLRAEYPAAVSIFRAFGDQQDNRLLVNLSYLYEHSLVEFKFSQLTNGEFNLHNARITARGLDFLADDGGLSAILGVVTVRLTEDTIKALLVDRVQNSEGDESVKAKLIDKIKSLPAEAVGTIAMSLVQAGLSNAPSALPLLQKMLGL